MRRRMRNGMAITIGVAILSVPLVIMRISFEIAFIGDKPAIEQLRSDMAQITGPASEDVIGQATSWNQKIQTLRAYNERIWAGPFIPDDWEEVALLPIPKGTDSDTSAVRLEQLGGEIVRLRLDVEKVVEEVQKDTKKQ